MNNWKLSLATTILALTACQPRHQLTPAEAILSKYLACYALDSATKSQCHQELAFEAEKLSFEQFIRAKHLACDAINEGPTFVDEQQAYLVKCLPNRQYFMQFDGDNQQWQLLKSFRTN